MRYFLTGLILLSTIAAFGSGPILSTKELNSPPPRIIRTCCAFGADVKMMGIPGLTVNQIMDIDQLGTHHYLGNPKEGIGIIYTKKGGFIDVGHLRDVADWTAYLYSKILASREDCGAKLKLGYEGGLKSLTLQLPENLDTLDAAILAGRIAYDLSVWHEIATWFGVSSVPLVPERYSSFSIEDPYSNLMGATLGVKAIKSDLPYEEAMTKLIAETLKELQAVHSEEATYAAMETVRDIWWTRDKKLPSRKILLRRQTTVYPIVHPLLIDKATDADYLYSLKVPAKNLAGEALTNFYALNFKLNLKFPFKKMFPQRKTRDITQMDFGVMLDYILQELEKPKYQLKDKF